MSNNSALAVEAYANLHNLQPYITYISARTSPDPHLLKPAPYLLNHALTALGTAPGGAVMIGDSATDMHAATASGTRSIGYANKPGKTGSLVKAGADQIVIRMAELTDALS